MVIRYRFLARDGLATAVVLEIGEPCQVQGQDLWACTIRWSGLDLPGKHGFGANPLGALENTLTIVRAVLDMEARDWRIEPMSE